MSEKKVEPKKSDTKQVVKKAKTHLASMRYGNPGRKVRIIIVTGEAGKTTTVRLIAELLREANFKVLEMVAARDGKRTFETEPGLLHRELREASRQSYDYVIIEAHESFLDGPILETIDVDTVVATTDNLQLSEILKWPIHHAILPHGLDVPTGMEHHNVMTFGTDEASDMKIADIKIFRRGLEMTIVIDQHTKIEIASYLVGTTNALNVAAALATAYVLGVDVSHFAEGVARVEMVQGNYNYIDTSAPYTVVVDSGSLVSLENLIETSRQLAKRRLLVSLARDIADDQLINLAKLADRIVTITDSALKEVDKVADHEEAAYIVLRGAKKDDLVVLIGPQYVESDEQGQTKAQKLVGHG
ncbi:MAG: Mur ligase family protein [Candidatus Saccharimonadaceae bacterium]